MKIEPPKVCDECGRMNRETRIFDDRRLCQECVENLMVCECGSEDVSPILVGDETSDKCADCGSVGKGYYRKWEDGE